MANKLLQRSLLVVVTIAVALIAYFVSQYTHSNEKGLAWDSLIIAKLGFLLLSRPFPARENIQKMRTFFQQQTKEQVIPTHLLGIQYITFDIPLLPIAVVDNITSIPVRIYNFNNDTAINAANKKPVLVWHHPGGWIFSDLDDIHVICLQLVHALPDYVIVSVDYRRAPEYPFPLPIYDAHSALHWIHREILTYGGDNHRMIFGGESSGANIALAVLTLNLDPLLIIATTTALTTATARIDAINTEDIVGLFLVYPPVSVSSDQSEYSQTNGFLTAESIESMRSIYLNNTAPNMLSAPMLIPDRILQRFPATLLVLAQFDVLYEENLLFYHRLTQTANNPQKRQLMVYNDTIHAFFGRSMISKRWGEQSVIDSARAMKQLLAI